MKKILTFFTLFLSLNLLAQEKVTISGYLKDAGNGEALIGATVSKLGTNIGATTNEYGFYSLSILKGKHTFLIQYNGYEALIKEFDLKNNQTLNFEMKEKNNQLIEVVITSKQDDQNVKSTEMSVVRLDIAQIQKMPVLFGEVDLIKSIQTLPGVTSVGEGASGFNVRGGNIDQNLILMDEAPVFNSSHMFGMFSIFNPDAVKDLKLMKGSIPAQFGGRTSSVLDIRMKEGNNKKLEVNGGIGTIFTRLSVEAPIIKNKVSFLVAARRSYIDVLARPFLKGEMKSTSAYFYDVNSKINWTINNKNTVYVSGYFGQDKLSTGFKFNYGNATLTGRWNHLFSNKLFSNLTAYHSRYNYFLAFNSSSFNFDWNANILTSSVKADFSYYPNSSNTIKFGAQAIHYTYKPGEIESVDNSEFPIKTAFPDQYGLENSLYVNNEQTLSNKFSLQYGLRWSFYNYLGKGKAYFFRDTAENLSRPVDYEKSYENYESIKFYNVPEPRLSMNYIINRKNSIKASFAASAQYLHLVSNTSASTPLDFYVPATNNIKPLTSNQYTVGFFKNFKENEFEASAEVYYKSLSNQLDYIDNSHLFLNKYLEGDLLQGKGRAYGIELFFKKNTGKLTGWVSYTLSKTERQVDGISNNDWFLSKYDRPQNASIVLMYELNKRLTLSTNFVYMSGTPSTFFDSKFEVQGYYFPHNSENKRGNYRVSAYHRLDLGLVYNFKGNDTRKWKSNIAVSIYNAYNRRNAYSVYFRNNPSSSSTSENEAIRYSVIGSIVPAITYNIKF